ncbi:peptidase S8/S53 domain-containing protein [Fusarium flagelliforme]|uniref:peptidase S8/S53 domain-containing protein n=1 Tax=Fusarium flagelliforme TaxID=2675880 RepID=UPI001E8DC923|nr:peptidase S8/S53 domain-containing protein [Fusarium flagelliforme]KAH7186192.1 peptidase S8/S53 domain-containing protein [Fusarium flagelliforme]
MMLKHYRMMPKLQTIITLPEPYLRLVLGGSSLTQSKEILVTEQTLICHETNPLGKLFVTLIDAVVGEEPSKVNFGFDLRQDAEIFARYVTIAQERLREYFFLGPMHGEQLIYSREYIDTTTAQQAGSEHFMLIARSSEDHTKREYRVIISKDKKRRRHYICFKVKGDIADVAWRGLLESLEDIEIWVADYDQNGRLVASLTTWEGLTKRQTTASNGRATFVKGGHERTADDWLGEIYKLIEVMKGDSNDRYERVKIAIIDSGLNDTAKMAQNTIVYKDFTNETRNDSWHGTCCAKIISDIYEEAELFIARIFEREHANDRDGPIRMAQAIDWAISPPNCVDIISISGGFRHYSKELDEATTRAKAAGVLVVAAAANWQNIGPVAFPARHNLTTMCIYSTNLGNQSSGFNPEPRDDTSRFAILGEGFQHPDQRRNEQMSGTSMATAVAAGLAASIIDFSRQADNKSYIPRAQDVGKLSGMLSIFGAISNRVGPLKYVDPLELLPSDHGSNRKRDRQRVREILSQAMERAN